MFKSDINQNRLFLVLFSANTFAVTGAFASEQASFNEVSVLSDCDNAAVGAVVRCQPD